MEAVALTRLEPWLAAQMLAGVEALDPRGIATPEDLARMCEHGQCFAATVKGGQAVYVLSVHHGQAWLNAAKGEGAVDLVATVLPVIELQCSEQKSVAFQTARPGLVRKARKQGYSVAGWILKKELSP